MSEPRLTPSETRTHTESAQRIWAARDTHPSPITRDRAACILDLLDRAEQAERDRDTLARELRNIAEAQPAKWEPDMRDQFQQWAQNRARDTLAQVARTEGGA